MDNIVSALPIANIFWLIVATFFDKSDAIIIELVFIGPLRLYKSVDRVKFLFILPIIQLDLRGGGFQKKKKS